ncbi:MAG: hypothetical protein AB7S26_17220 [Sandaracinaceae bacterium]
MLPPYIIEELRRREEARREEGSRPQPRVELPIPERAPHPSEHPSGEDPRGVVIIEVF